MKKNDDNDDDCDHDVDVDDDGDDDGEHGVGGCAVQSWSDV